MAEEEEQMFLTRQEVVYTRQDQPGVYYIAASKPEDTCSTQLTDISLPRSSSGFSELPVSAVASEHSDFVCTESNDDAVDQIVNMAEQQNEVSAVTLEEAAASILEGNIDALDEEPGENQLSADGDLQMSNTIPNNTGELTHEHEVDNQKEENVTVAEVDVSNPIELSHNIIVTINGKKCILQQDAATGAMVGYPLRMEGEAPKRRRGRPRKVRPEPGTVEAPTDASKGKKSSEEWENEKEQGNKSGEEKVPEEEKEEEKAAQGLLELRHSSGLTVKRSSRRRKPARKFENIYDKKLSQLSDLELSSSSGEEDYDENDKDVVLPNLAPNFPGMKRKRGRPAKHSKSARPTVPFNDLGGLLMPLKRKRGRPKRSGPPPPPTVQAIMLKGADGQTILMTLPQQQPSGRTLFYEGQTEKIPVMIQQDTAAAAHTEDELAASALIQEGAAATDTTPLVDDGQSQLMSVVAVPAVTPLLTEGAAKPAAAKGRGRPPKVAKSVVQEGQATIVPIRADLLPGLAPAVNSEPIKLGLKTSESSIEKLKCCKCGFQAYYQQQYQEHIVTHQGDVHKCKCCNFHTFESEELLLHFMANHPKCICPLCNFMAEYAYIIRRHMFRHSRAEAECEICGKKYKDQYILKMHIKLVHMPADVLFECTICGKKFNRKAHLKRHIRTHDPDKPYKCPSCDYRGCERSDVTKHLLIHDNPKFNCELCGKNFRHFKNLDLHMKRHKGQRDYKCGICEFYGYTFTDIRKHIERKHADSRALICVNCGLCFKNVQELKDHVACKCESLEVEQVTGTGEDTMDVEDIHIAEEITDEQLAGHIVIACSDDNSKNILTQSELTSQEVVETLEGDATLQNQVLNISETQATSADGTRQIIVHEADGQILVTTIDGVTGQLLVGSEDQVCNAQILTAEEFENLSSDTMVVEDEQGSEGVAQYVVTRGENGEAVLKLAV